MTGPVRQVVEGRRADTVRRLLDATLEELRAVGFQALTVRSVAKRAQVSPATAYSYFSSKEHLVTAVFWQKIQALPSGEPGRPGQPSANVGSVTAAVAQLLADEQALAQACTVALLADQQEVRRLRDEIGREVYRRLAGAVGAGTDPAIHRAVVTAFAGALVLAGSGYLAFDEVADHLAEITELMLHGSAGVRSSRRRTSADGRKRQPS